MIHMTARENISLLLVLLLSLIHISFATTPLRIAIYLGLIIVSISFFYGIYVFYHALLDSNNRSGYATIVLLLLFIGGVIILLLGVIGEYLARIYMEVKHRPDVYKRQA